VTFILYHPLAGKTSNYLESENVIHTLSTMQATIGTLSRIFQRSLISGVVDRSQATNSISYKVSSKDGETIEGDDHTTAELTTAVSGFPKAKNGQYNIDNILKGQIGDDAYFIARHVDDWNNNTNETPDQLLSPTSDKSKEQVQPLDHEEGGPVGGGDLSHQSRGRRTSADVIGVADGVGGWRAYGVDPGQFSLNLMQNCERLVKAGYFVSNQPSQLLASGFREMQESKRPIIGSSTACVAILNHEDCKLYTANIGDSGFLVFRGGQVVHRSHEQQHYFNTPFQLSLPPSNMAADVLSDAPESADQYEFSVEDGDVIMLATDGVFDNIPDSILVEEIGILQNGPLDAAKIQAVANSIALIARKLSQDDTFLSPFAKNARANGFWNVIGGKEDDVTVILASVNLTTNQLRMTSSAASEHLHHQPPENNTQQT